MDTQLCSPALRYTVFLFLIFSLTVSAQTARQLEHDDYAIWNDVESQEISRDGAWINYIYGPEDGDPTLGIQNTADESRTLLLPQGDRARFSANSAYAVFLVKPLKDSVKAVKKRSKKKEDLPRDTLAIVALSDLSIEKPGTVSSFKLAEWLLSLLRQREQNNVV